MDNRWELSVLRDAIENVLCIALRLLNPCIYRVGLVHFTFNQDKKSTTGQLSATLVYVLEYNTVASFFFSRLKI
jgi:hypothetical protein